MRSSKKYPNLDKKMHTKRRQNYVDSIYYVNGVKNRDGEEVIRPLNDSEKEFMDKFIKEYYCASFDPNDENNLHKKKVDDVTIYNIRQKLSELRASQYKTKCPEELAGIYSEIEELDDYLAEVYPQKKCTDDNNSRNIDLLNLGTATNQVKFIPWETLDQNTLGDLDIDLLYLLNDIDKEDKDD